MATRKYKYSERVANPYPVHPKVAEARKRVIKLFMTEPFDEMAWAVANRRLAYLLHKYNPVESRPFDQVSEQEQYRRLKQYILQVA